MRTLAAVLVVLAGAVAGSPAEGLSEPYGATVLKTVVVTLAVPTPGLGSRDVPIEPDDRVRATSPATGQGGVCHGFLYAIAKISAYVVTARHCVEEPAQARLTPGMQWRDLREFVSVTFANHSAGRAYGAYWAPNNDVVVLKTTVAMPRPKPYIEVCQCGYYRTLGPGQHISILSTLSTEGGPPAVSSGSLVTGPSGRYSVFLPGAPGTSGSMVVDLQGKFVGTVWGGWTRTKEGTGFLSAITPASMVIGLLRYAFYRDGVPFTFQ